MRQRHHQPGSNLGLTLVELIVCVAIVGILAAGALPIARFQVKRQKEKQLRSDLSVMRNAIDRYKDAADRGAFMVDKNTFGYPKTLQVLVDGVDVEDKKVKFLKEIPVDPMTGQADWGMRSVQDDADSTAWGGEDVFNVYSTSQKTALNGTKYNTW